MAIYNMGVMHLSLRFVGVEIFTNFWFLIDDFDSKYARKAIKSSKDDDHSLVSKKKLEPKNGSSVWRPGPGKVSQKIAKTCPHYDFTHREPQIHNKNLVFQSQLEDLLSP